MKAKLLGFLKDEEGQGMVEYGLIIALVAIVVMAALSTMSGGLTAIFGKITDAVNPPPAGG